MSDSRRRNEYRTFSDILTQATGFNFDIESYFTGIEKWILGKRVIFGKREEYRMENALDGTIRNVLNTKYN